MRSICRTSRSTSHKSSRPARPTTRRPPFALATAAMALAALACTPRTQATQDESQTSGDAAQIVVEAFIVEVQRPVFDTGYEAVAAAARGQSADLLPTGTGATLAERLKAAEESGALTILAAPRFIVGSGERAYAQSGLQIPVQTVTDNTITVQFVNATLRLEVSPQLRETGEISLHVSAQKRFPDLTTVLEKAPASPIQTTELATTLTVADGGSALLGGIFETRGAAQDGANQAPGKELVVLVTPRILDL